MAGSGSRARRRKATNEATKAKSAAATKQYWDELGQGEKVGWKDIGETAAGAIPGVGAALAGKAALQGGLTAGSAVGAAGDVAEGAGKAGLKSVGRVAAGAAGTVAGIVGAADALSGAAKLYNKKAYQEMTPEERAARRGQTAASRRGSRSPLKQVNPYAGNYTFLSKAVGGAVGQAVAENREREDRRIAEEQRLLDNERRAQQAEMQQLQLAELKTKQAEALIVPGDSGFNNLDTAINSASRQLVDQAGNLTNLLKSGEIDTDQYAQQLAVIRQQVPGIKTFKDTLTTNLSTYTEGLQSGQLSAAQNPQVEKLYGALLADDGSMELGVNEDGVVTFSGIAGDEEVSIPVNGVAQMPTPTLKTAAPWEVLKPAMKNLQSEKNFWDDDSAEYAKGELDKFLSSQGEKGLLSLAVDHYGMSLEEAKALEGEPADGYSSRLEQEIEGAWVQTANQTFLSDQLNAAQQQQAQLQRERAALAQQGTSAGNASLIKAQLAAQQRANTTNLFNTAVSSGDFSSLQGLEGISKVSRDTFGNEWTIHIGDEKVRVDPDKPASYQILKNYLGIIGEGQQGGQTGGAIEDINFDL